MPPYGSINQFDPSNNAMQVQCRFLEVCKDDFILIIRVPVQNSSTKAAFWHQKVIVFKLRGCQINRLEKRWVVNKNAYSEGDCTGAAHSKCSV